MNTANDAPAMGFAAPPHKTSTKRCTCRDRRTQTAGHKEPRLGFRDPMLSRCKQAQRSSQKLRNECPLWLQNRRLCRRLWRLSQQLLWYLKTLCWYAMHLLAMIGKPAMRTRCFNLRVWEYIAPYPLSTWRGGAAWLRRMQHAQVALYIPMNIMNIMNFLATRQTRYVYTS